MSEFVPINTVAYLDTQDEDQMVEGCRAGLEIVRNPVVTRAAASTTAGEMGWRMPATPMLIHINGRSLPRWRGGSGRTELGN